MPRADSKPAIVVGVDGSDNGWRALDWALEEADRRDCPARMIFAYDTIGSRAGRDRMPQRSMIAMYDEGRTVFTAARAHLSGSNGDDGRHADRLVGTALQEGAPGQVLTELGIDAVMCVVGRHGARRSASSALGSTSLTLAVRTQVPLVVVPPDWDAGGATGRSVLVGVDVTAPCVRALAFAFRTAHLASVPLVALCTRAGPRDRGHRWEQLPSHGGGGSRWMRVRPVADREVALADAARTLLAPWGAEYPDVSLTSVVEEAHPVAALADHGHDCGLLVIGGETYPSTGVVTGSVARSILRQATCPVAVVPDPAPEPSVP